MIEARVAMNIGHANASNIPSSLRQFLNSSRPEAFAGLHRRNWPQSFLSRSAALTNAENDPYACEMQSLQSASKTAPAQDVSVSGCAKAVLDGLPQVMWFIRRHMRQHRTSGLSVPQFRTLVLLDRYPGANVSLVSEQLGATLPTASRLVAGMVRRGLIKRQQSEHDRRQASLVLTSRGESSLEASRQATTGQIEDRLRRLNASERSMVAWTMQTLGQTFRDTCRTEAEANGMGADEKPRSKVPKNRRPQKRTTELVEL